MKSLFVRLLLTLWVSTAILVGVFALIHAWAFDAQPSNVIRRLGARSIELRAESAYLCHRDGLTNCTTIIEPMDARDQTIAIYRDGAVFLGAPIEGASEAMAARASDGSTVRKNEREVAAFPFRRDPSMTIVASGPVRSPWMFFIVPETLPYRLLAIFAGTGLVSVLLARYLSRPVRVLKRAAQRMSAGDLTVRVAHELESADGETLELGREMDRMAHRISDLLEAQKQLLRDVSHELRSPLARLNISLELVRRRCPPDVEPALLRIERDTDRLNTMIGELLTLSRLESNRAIEKPEAVDLDALVEDVVGDVAYEAEQQGVEVVVESEVDADVDGSRELLRRAIENVLRNAVRFTEPGSSIEVKLERTGDRAKLVVRDHGPGVPEDALKKIFEPFHRVATDRARASGGTGIGLAITERAVALHGGHVVATNAEGSGLRVEIELPVHDHRPAA